MSIDSQTGEGPATPNDGELIRRVAAGDRTAFEELHGRYARAVYGLALRRIRDRGRAEDATQEAFAALWRSASRYDPTRGSGAPWFFVVARNAVTDVLRKTPEVAVDTSADRVSDEPGPDQRAEADWEAWQVHRAVEGLPDTERPLVELAYWGGLSQSEIAGYLGLPLGTVKTRTRAALTRLARALEEELQ
jgi:RNA polymerase sigma-70 factor (ECF subfamily)